MSANSRLRVAGGLRPRRLTPVEVERCFGFADGYTAIPGAKDSPRYTALGNSMAVPVIRWLGERILKVDEIVRPDAMPVPAEGGGGERRRCPLTTSVTVSYKA